MIDTLSISSSVKRCDSKTTYRAKEKIMKMHYIKKETVFHHISHTVERKISTKIFSTNSKVFDIVMRQEDSLRRRDSPRGVSLGVVGMCHPVLRILTLF